MAITYDLATTGTTGYPAMDKSGVYRIEKKVDWSTLATAPVQTDILQIINIPANTFVLGVYYSVTTASALLDDLDIGDAVDADGWADGIDATSTGAAFSRALVLTEGAPNTLVPANGLGKFYAAADTIDLTQNTDATVVDGVIKVVALCMDCNFTT